MKTIKRRRFWVIPLALSLILSSRLCRWFNGRKWGNPVGELPCACFAYFDERIIVKKMGEILPHFYLNTDEGVVEWIPVYEDGEKEAKEFKLDEVVYADLHTDDGDCDTVSLDDGNMFGLPIDEDLEEE